VRLAIVALLITGALAVAGCGEDRNAATTAAAPATSSRPVVDAALKTASAGGVKVSAHGAADILGQRAPVDATGAFDLRRRTGRFSGTTRLAGRSVQVDGIAAGHDVYLRSDALAGRLPSGRRWVKVDVAQALSGIDPGRSLRNLKDAGDVRRVGRATVGGVATTEYAGRAHGGRFEVWVGDDGLVRRAHLAGARGDLTVTLSGFGTRVAAQPPPASAVYDATGVVRSLIR
jgi:hypothetical protein